MLLEQILDNLVSNAIKFSPFQRSVWVRIRMGSDGYLIFEVEDQGPGIRPEEQAKLFKTFQRLSATPTGGETSTGLGLSIVKAIASQLGGEISVLSEFGKGATFTLKIPRKE
jgi:signal transduction histidine kinase